MCHQLIPLSAKQFVLVWMIVVLHKPVALGIYRLNEWYQVLIQGLTVKLSIHDAFKYTRTSSTVPADACPYMYFHRVLWSRLVAGFLSCFPATKSAVCFHLLQDGGASVSLSTTLKGHRLFGWTSWGTAYCQQSSGPEYADIKT